MLYNTSFLSQDRPRQVKLRPVAQSRAFQEALAEASRFRIIQ